ncbi:MAG: L-cystine transport system permease protein YecS [Paracidovorax wautersii]|uniref:L-cystine transport system permease protein YecS n=1 Tax=Paracidovorax wautersii TaxID=1177982 RepID=A0A7V8JQ60_9BURK|nr:MAG: L-cystine transport system permease protein YecS [Paracidovorax wautersii]
MDWNLLAQIAPAFARAAALTLLVSAGAALLGLLGGFALNVCREFWAGVRPLYGAFIGLIRGTPFLIQLFILYYGLPQVGITFTPIAATVIGLGVYASAYFAEIFRASWQSIPAGQIEAARVFGLTRLQILRHIQAPQALRLALPMVTNQLILVLKESSVASIITVPELTMTAGTVVAETFSYVEPYLLLGLIYWLMAVALSRLGRLTEKACHATASART